MAATSRLAQLSEILSQSTPSAEGNFSVSAMWDEFQALGKGVNSYNRDFFFSSERALLQKTIEFAEAFQRKLTPDEEEGQV